MTVHLSTIRNDLKVCAAKPDSAPWAPAGPFYTDPDYHEFECATVLRRGWHCIGRVDEMPNKGDYRALTLLGEPVVIVNDGDGFQAHSNLCKHRSMPLMYGSGNAKRFVCRYHAWTYDLDGALLRAPRMKNEGFDPKTCKLTGFACEVRFGFVYVNISETPEDLDVALAGLSELISPYRPDNYRLVHSATEEWRCNWKCLVENFMEGYHLSVVHPQTLHGYTPTGLAKKGPAGPGFTSYLANYPETILRGQGSPDLDEGERRRSTLFSVFPCQVVSIAASLLVSLSIRPLAADRIEVHWTMSAYGDELDEETIRQRVTLWDNVNREDREKLEDMQIGLGSAHAKGGPLAGPDYEGTVRDFIKWLGAQDALSPEFA